MSDASEVAAATESPTGPPLAFLLLAVVGVLVSLLLLFSGGFGSNVAGYVTGSIIPILAVGVFRHFDLIRRISPFYVPRPVVGRLIPVILVVGLVAVVLHTWAIATEIAS